MRAFGWLICMCAGVLLTPPDGCGRIQPEETWVRWDIPAPSVRALEVVSESEIWYAGAAGHYGYTLDAGDTWHHDSIGDRSFRSLAVAGGAVHLLTIESPAILLRSENRGMSWDTVFVDADSAAFYDSMVFFNDAEGLAMGDPVDDCLRVIETRDSGQTWSLIPCSVLPKTRPGEAGFAASNTNIAVQGEQAWIATGGSAARVFHSSDCARTWSVMETPMNQGGQMTGTFGMAMSGSGQTGLLVGGDWSQKQQTEGSMAQTLDGGATWKAVKGVGYQSCVQFDPTDPAGGRVIALGTPGIHRSEDAGQTWGQASISDTLYYTARYAPSGEVVWLAGRGVIARWHLD